MNQLEIIENDLKQLQAEVKKKHTALRESLNNAVIVFLSYKNSQGRDSLSSFPIGEIMRPMELIPATKSEKIIVQALNMFKNMLNYGYLKDKYLLSVLSFLESSLDIPEDNIQVKLLQTILLFITPKHLDFNKFELIEKLFNLTLQMYNSKNIIIHNTASAALFQLADIIFERFASYVKGSKPQNPSAGEQEEEKFELSQFFYQKCIKLLREFIMITNGLKPDWMPPNMTIPRNTGLDLINSVLKQVGGTMKQSKEAHQLIKKDLIPILSTCFEPKSNDFQGLVRVGRATSRIILSLYDGLELVDCLVSLLNHSESDYEKYICVETLTLISASPDVLKMLNERHMSTISYFMEICNSLLKLCKEVTENPDLDRKRYSPLNPKLQRILDSNLTEYEIPTITCSNIYKSLTDFFTTSTESFIYLSERCDFKLGTTDNTSTKHEQKNFIEWLTQGWKPILKCLKYLLPKQVDESMTQHLLNTFQKMISLTGSLGLTQARDSYIVTLCQSCLPYDDHSLKELTLKNIQATKTVFNIAHCLGAILDINSWHSIFLTLQKTEILFDRIRNQIAPHPSPTASRLSLSKTEQDKDAIKRLITQEDETSLVLDLQILSAALDSLFSQSLNYPMEHFKSFFEALNQLSLEYMEKVTTSETLVIEGVTIEGKAKIFGLSRMLETILVNLDRIELFWDSILAHYVCIATNSKNVILRNRGVENLNILIEKTFQYFIQRKAKETPSTTPSNQQTEDTAVSEEGAKEVHLKDEEAKKKKMSEMWSKENWQKTLFQPWLEISKTKFHDVKENICLALLKLLQNNGHEIDQDGWSVIACVLFELSQESMGTAINIGFRCLEMIINDYLQEVGLGSVTILINVTENFKKISSDNNMSYQSVGMFWKIGDYLAKVQDEEQKKGKEGMEGFDELWILILNRLATFASDEHSELRTSAIHTLTNLMVHHGYILGKNLWNRVISELIFRLVDEVLEVYISNTRGDNQPQSAGKPGGNKADKELQSKAAEDKAKTMKQWEDTLTILLQNLMKIIKKYISIIEKLPDLHSQSPEILVLKNVLIKVKAFIMVAKNDLIAESIKFFHEMILTKPEILSFLLDTIFDVLGIVRTFLIEVRQDGKEIKIILNKFIPEVLEILSEIFAPQRYAILNPQKTPYAKNLFDIIEKIIFYAKQAETFNSISQNAKIIVDAKNVYDFLEKVPTVLCENNEDMIKQYFQFMIHILGLPLSDKFTDSVVRRFTAILDHVISSRVFSESVYLPYLPLILEKLRNILCLRCNTEFLTLMVNNAKNTLPIWLYATDYFHNIVAQVLGFFSLKASNEDAESNGVSEEDKETQKILTNQIIEIYEAVLKSAEKSFDNISKGLLVEIKKSWFEMDMKFIHAIGDILMPNFSVMDHELLWKLIHILDFTFSFYSKNPIFTEQAGAYNASYGKDPAASSTISKITLEILFKISEGCQDLQLSGSPKHSDIKKRLDLAKLATKKLIIKCRRILKLYIYDDQRSGNMPLPKNRLLEITYILEKLRKLSIPLDSFLPVPADELNIDLQDKAAPYNGNLQLDDDEEEPGTNSLANLRSGTSKLEEIAQIKVTSHPDMDMKVLKGPKGHLIYLMPLFAEAITCRDPELKDLLKKIFLEVSKALGILSF